MYGPMYGIKFVIAQKNANSTGAFNPIIENPIIETMNSIRLINSVPFTNLCITIDISFIMYSPCFLTFLGNKFNRWSVTLLKLNSK